VIYWLLALWLGLINPFQCSLAQQGAGGCVVASGGTPAHIQDTESECTATSCTATFTSNLVSGHSIYAIILVDSPTSGSAPGTISVPPTDSTNAGNTFSCTTQVNYTSALQYENGYLFCCAHVSTGGSKDVISVSINETVDIAMNISEFSNVGCNIDANNSSSDQNVSPSTSGSYSTTHANEIALAMQGDGNANPPSGGWTAGAGFTLMSGGVGLAYQPEYQVYTSTQSGVTASISWSPATGGIIQGGFQVVTFY
jgi:hypothetical protein